METKCPHCNVKLKVPDEYKGKKVKCPKCKQSFEMAEDKDAHIGSAQEPHPVNTGVSKIILAAIISGALAATFGFVCGAILTKQSRLDTERKMKEAQVAMQQAIENSNELENEVTQLRAANKKLEQQLKAAKTKPLRKAAPTPKQEKVAMPKYSVLNEEIEDIPGVKTRVELNILVSGEITEAGLRALLNNLYFSIKDRFKYHNPPAMIGISAFTSKERYESGWAQWIAMLLQGPHLSVEPEVTINKPELAQIGAKPEKKFGLSENTRKEIWQESVLIEDRAWEEAEKRYPRDAGMSSSEYRTQLQKLQRFREQLQKEDEDKLAKKYGLTRKQLEEIIMEGISKSWTLPK